MIRAIALAACVCAGPASGQVWKELGPAPLAGSLYTGRVPAVACSPTDPDRYYVGGADGGVWRTDDGGQSWTPLTDHMPCSAIGAIAIDPSNHDVVYVGTGEANFANHSRYGLGVYKTIDGGANWEHLAESTFAGRCFSRIVIDPQNTQTLYAAIAIAGGFPSLAAAKLHPQRSGPLGVFKSTDGGVSWLHLTNGLPGVSATALVIDPSNPQVLYAGIGHIFGNTANGAYKSVNAGASWTKLAGGLPTALAGRVTLGISPSEPQRLYAHFGLPTDPGGGGSGGLGFFTTTNGGAAWTLVNSGSGPTYQWYFGVIGVHPTNPAIACYGNLNITWSGAALGTPAHVDQHAIAWDAAGRIVAGCDGGVYRNPGTGGTWTPLNTGLGIIQIYPGLSTHPTNPEFVLGGFQDNGSAKRTADSLVWTQVTGGDGGWTQINQSNPSIMFTESQGTANLSRSTNGGNSFGGAGAGITGRNCFLPPYIVDPVNGNRVLYGTERVFRSMNGGSNDWAAISPDLTASTTAAIRALAIAPSDPQVVYAATNNGRVLASTDGGINFALILDNIPGWPRVTREIFVDPTDAMAMYLAVAAFGETQVRRTPDGGQSWEPLDATLPDIPVNVVAADTRCGKPMLYAGTDQGMYRSADDGASWSKYGQGLPNCWVTDIRMEPSRGRMVVSTMGRGAWRVPIFRAVDLNEDGQLTIADFAAFQTAFVLQQLRADFNDDDQLTIADFGAFQTAFVQGCQ